MRKGTISALVLALAVALLGACASGGGSSTDDTARAKPTNAYPEGYSEPPAGSKLAKVEVGMNDTDVRKIMGEPDDSNAYITGKSFYMPWSPDKSRSDWMYRGQGRVVFSRNSYSGRLRVIRVMYNPNE